MQSAQVLAHSSLVKAKLLLLRLPKLGWGSLHPWPKVCILLGVEIEDPAAVLFPKRR